jgi:predicted patatin/cPLA2 family phospholipase
MDLMNNAFRSGPKAFEFDNILNHPTETHVYARSVNDGRLVDFNIGQHSLDQEQGPHIENDEYVYFCHNPEDVLKAVAATTHLPFYGGPPVKVAKNLDCVDGGLSAAGRVPLRRAIDSGASHVFVFWTDERVSPDYRRDKYEKFAAWWLHRRHPGIGDYWLGDNEHRHTIRTINQIEQDGGKLPLVEIVRVPGHEIPSSTETDPKVIYRATLAGRMAMLKVFEPYNLPLDTTVNFPAPKQR